jgi:hypothetical protein
LLLRAYGLKRSRRVAVSAQRLHRIGQADRLDVAALRRSLVAYTDPCSGLARAAADLQIGEELIEYSYRFSDRFSANLTSSSVSTRGPAALRRQFSGEKAAGTASTFSCFSSRSPPPPGGGQMPRFTASARMRSRSPASL